MPTLRPYQAQLEHGIYSAWAELEAANPVPPPGGHVVGIQSPTGSGKTVTFCDVMSAHNCASAAIAHRKELVSQMSIALARNGVRHRVVGPDALRREITSLHMAELGRSYYDPSARCGVVGIDSLPGLSDCDPWLNQVQLWIGDEGHHFLRENKWGQGVAKLRNARRGLLASATWFRADGKGLGRGVLLPDGKWSNDGIADRLVLGPSMRDLIDQGYLTDYKLIAPESDIDYSQVPVTESGDLSPAKLRAAVHKSTRIVGDVVEHYLKFAAGKVGVTFAVDIEAATEIAAAYRAAGVPAEVISSKTPPALRALLLRQLRNREILQLVNVDLFGEGFDLPAIEVVSMVRKTESKSLYDQQFGRGLRLMISKDLQDRWDTFTDTERRAHIAASPKPYAIIIDHVGNWERHLPPDGPRFHTLDRRERRARTLPVDAIPLRACLNKNPLCLRTYERVLPKCPYCGHKPVPTERSAPELVDGDLAEVDPAVIAALCGRVAKVDGAFYAPAGLEGAAAQAAKNRHVERQHAQRELRGAIALWSGYQTVLGREMAEQHRRFFHMFGIDVLTAQSLGRPEAEALHARITERLTADGIVSSVGHAQLPEFA
jgi:superfamily II DNA or RNA helicase